MASEVVDVEKAPKSRLEFENLENRKYNPRISFEDIKQATRYFHKANLIGRGGFGSVYKGDLQDGDGFKTVVAKRLDTRLGQGEQQFLSELQILLEYKHENVIGLVGYCDEQDEKIIVYEYASRGSLDRYLNDGSLTWVKRLHICIDVASALDFLHGGAGKQARVIHRDIKTENILLNDDWKAKLSDFGLSLQSSINQESDYVIDHACGTPGYLDPLYSKSGFLTTESDIYSFGVVLFEMLCGRSTYAIRKHEGHYLQDFVKRKTEEGKLDEVVMEQIREQILPKSLNTFQKIAYQCLHNEREQRPTAKEVLSQLKKALEFQGWKLHQLDVNNAFLHGHLTECVYMEQPPGFIDPKFPNHVCKLNRAIYGLKQAPRAWFQRLSNFLVAYGFTCSKADTSLFIFRRDTTIMFLLVYVDDLILTGNQPSVLQKFMHDLHLEFAIKDLGDLNYFLGLEVVHMDNGLFLHQSKYASDILKRANMLEAKPAFTPMSTSVVLSSTGDPFHDPTLYRSLVGALQYLTITRPDISYAVNQVSQYLHSPTIDHFQEVKRILRYVKGTLSFGLNFTKPSAPTLLGYSDADWARCLETRRSTYGFSIFFGGNLVSWSAKKQPTVSRSSCESEYRAMANTAAEIIWLTHLLQELGFLPNARPTLLCDNQSALFLTQNPIAHKRIKHLELDYHFIRELVTSGKLLTRFVPSKLQVADIFTKGLPRSQFEFFRRLLRLGPPPFRLRGDINHTPHQ